MGRERRPSSHFWHNPHARHVNPTYPAEFSTVDVLALLDESGTVMPPLHILHLENELVDAHLIRETLISQEITATILRVETEAELRTLKMGATDYILKQGLQRLGRSITTALSQVAEDRQRLEADNLGLAICRRTVEEHRGTISIKSFPSKGTTVGITRPTTEEGVASAA